MKARVSSLAVLGVVALLGAEAFANRGAIEVRRGSEVERRREETGRAGETRSRVSREAVRGGTRLNAGPRLNPEGVVDSVSEAGNTGSIRSRAAGEIVAPTSNSANTGRGGSAEVLRAETGGIANPARSLAELNLLPSVKAEIESLELSGEKLEQVLEVARAVTEVDAPIAPEVRDRAEQMAVNNAVMQKYGNKALVTADFVRMCLRDFSVEPRTNATEVYGSNEARRAAETGDRLQVREALVLKLKEVLEDESIEQSRARLDTIERQCNKVAAI